MLILPLFPALGALSLFLVMVAVWQRHYRQMVSDRVNWAWGVLASWLILNSALAYQPSEAWLGLANFLPFLGLFAALRLVIDKPQELKRLAWSIVIPSLPIVILGLGQLYGGWSTPQWLGNILGWNLVPQGEPPGRMSSVFIYANFLAVYLAIAFILTCGLWIDTWQQRKLIKKPLGLLSGLMFILLVNSVGLVLTSSRSAWGIAFFSLMAFAIYLGWRWLVYAATAFTSVILWASFAPSWGGEWLRPIVPAFFWARLSDQMYPDRPVATLRTTQWEFCLDLIKQRPLTGWGLRNFTPLYESKMNVWFGHPHSLFLMLAVEIGLIATVLLLGIVGWIIAKAILAKLRSGDLEEICFADRDRWGVIFFSYLVAFTGCILFNLFDVTIFDLRANTLSWILLAAIAKKH
ncbi:MAG: O-antigen ligase family protein [Pleurocapsa sp.]